MTMSQKLVFFGNERLISGLRHTETPILRGLIERGYTICAIVVSHNEGVSRNKRPLEVAEIAAQYHIPILSPHHPIDILDQLRNYRADAAVLSAYGRILPEGIINVFSPIGIINIHPSLLPLHRGPTPIESTILCGDITAGVSIMQLAPGMDDGPLFAQTSFPIPPDIDKFDLYKKLAQTGADLLLRLLPDILSGSLLPIPQKTIGSSTTPLITKKDGYLDLSAFTAQQLERMIRAYQGFPKPHLTLFGYDIIVITAKATHDLKQGTLTVPCAGSTLLEVISLTAPSGRTMSGQDFLRGYGKK